MYRTRSKGTTLHENCKSSPPKLRSLYVVLARASGLEAANGVRENSDAELENKPSTSKTASRKGLKTGYVVLQRIDSESLNNSLAGEADNSAAVTKSDKPDAPTTKASSRPGKENLVEFGSGKVQKKATKSGAKAGNKETASSSKGQDGERKTTRTRSKKDEEKKEDKKAKDITPVAEAPRAVRKAKPVAPERTNEKHDSSVSPVVQLNARGLPRRACLKPAEVPQKKNKQPNSKKVVSSKPELDSQNKKVAESEEQQVKIVSNSEANDAKPTRRAAKTKAGSERPLPRTSRSRTVDARPVASQAAPKAAVAETTNTEETKDNTEATKSEANAARLTRRAASKIKVDGERPPPRASRSRTVDAHLVAPHAVPKVTVTKSTESEETKDNSHLSVVQQRAKRYPRQACSTSNQQELPSKSKKQSNATKPVKHQKGAEAEKLDSKTSADAETTKNKKTPDSNEPAETAVQTKTKATSTKTTLDNEIEPSSAEAVKLPAARRRKVYVETTLNSAEMNTGSFKNRPENNSLNNSSKVMSTPEFRKKFKFPEPAAKASSKEVIEDDPYSFNLSQSEPTATKSKHVKVKKRAAKPKPGSNMELLIQKKKLEAVGSSCNVQQNPVRYQAERTELQKQLDVSTFTAPIINLDNQPVRRSAIAQQLSDPSSASSSHRRSSKFFVPLTEKPVAKVVHSPKPIISAITESPEAFVSDSPPIMSTYASQMAQIAQKQIAKSTPFRVNGNLPSPFYMHLSGNDGTPSFSSDLLEKDPGGCDASPEKSVLTVPAAPEQAVTAAIAEVHQESQSILDDSNAENIAPENAPKKVNKTKPANQSRSPLKALPITALAQVPSTVTLRKHVATEKKSKPPIVNPDESMDFDDHSPSESDQESRDSFGFDELLEHDKQPQAGPSDGPSTSGNDYQAKVENLKQYLPSKNNKSRDKNLFPTSPCKHIRLLHSPMKDSTPNIRQFMTSSTPMLNRPKPSTTFNETLDLTEGKNAGDETQVEEVSEEHLFDEQEVAPVSIYFY